jgi:hypothetical protein
MTNTINTLFRFIPGEPPRIKSTRMDMGLEGVRTRLSTPLLEVGEELACMRDGQVVRTATVLDDGRIHTGGRTFDSPSAAAKYALVVDSANGWREWISLRDGPEALEEKRFRAGLVPR